MPRTDYQRMCDRRTAAEHAFSDPDGSTHGEIAEAVRGAAAVLRGSLEGYYTKEKAHALLHEILAALPRLEHEGDQTCDHPATAMGRLLDEALRDEQVTLRIQGCGIPGRVEDGWTFPIPLIDS